MQSDETTPREKPDLRSTMEVKSLFGPHTLIRHKGAALDDNHAITIAFTFQPSETKTSTGPNEWSNKSFRCSG